MPSGLLLSLLFGVEGGPPPPPPAVSPAGVPNELGGAFGGRGGALPGRHLSARDQWRQWNVKLGNLPSLEEEKLWREHLGRRYGLPAVERKLIEEEKLRQEHLEELARRRGERKLKDEVTQKHRDGLILRDQELEEKQKFRQKMNDAQYLVRLKQEKQIEAAQEIEATAQRIGLRAKVIIPPLNLEKLRQERLAREAQEQINRDRRKKMQQIEDEKALQMKIKMAKVRAAKQNKRRK